MSRLAAFLAAGLMMLASLAGDSPPEGLVHVELAPIPGVSTAGLDYRTDVSPGSAAGIVVLVPGCNGDGTAWLDDAAWCDFARTNKFVLAAFTFVSKVDDLCEEKGYYDVAAGSAESAAAALKKLGAGRIPVFMYGFSGGAHFTAGFADCQPQMLRCWCAASFEEKTRRTAIAKDDGNVRRPPGIVACGSDDPRLGAALSYYDRGRAAGRRWTWVEVPGLDHSRSPELEAFVRGYFAALAKKKAPPGVWVDVGSGEDVAHSAASARELQTWLPSREMVPEWRSLSARKTQAVIEHAVKMKLKDYERLTLFLRLPSSGRPEGVLCMSLLANSPNEVREHIRSGASNRGDSLLDFAERHGLAVVAWGSRCLWDPSRNWDELSRTEARKIDADFDVVAGAWDSAMDFFVKRYGIPASGYLMTGSSGAAQYAQRLALRRPERFLAVHVHIPSSFDAQVKGGASILWCVTTGENELGYARSRRFFRAARDMAYPIVYKAYPGLGHEGNAYYSKLGFACFEYALDEYARATRLNGGKPAKPDWADIFSSAPSVADIFNQSIYSKFDYQCVPLEFRMLLPSQAIRKAWIRE